VTTKLSPKYTRFANVYDDAYHFIDYGRSAGWMRDLIHARHPDAQTLLELACGTGRYLELLAGDFVVEGLDLSPEMLAKARTRVPSVPLHEGDMTEFRLDRRYDVVCCLFRSIGYVGTTQKLERAVAAMARHVAENGIVLIEPFFTPDAYWVNRVTLNDYKRDDLALAWMYVSEREASLARLRINCLVGTPAGVEHFVEVHELGLFTRDDFEKAFATAGLQLEYESDAPGGTGLYIGRAR
jgi:dTDP-3-amino-3,4,6-trideoxy-alpha-D-glucopyranose N,N-dimethyltransferase